MTCARRKLGSPATRIVAAAFGLTLVLLVVRRAVMFTARSPARGQTPSPCSRTSATSTRVEASSSLRTASTSQWATGARSSCGRSLRVARSGSSRIPPTSSTSRSSSRARKYYPIHKDAEARIWDPLTARLLSSTKINGLEPATYISAMSHHPEHNVVVLTPRDGSVSLWDYKKREARKFVFDSAKENPTVGGGRDVVERRQDVDRRRRHGGQALRRGDKKADRHGPAAQRFAHRALRDCSTRA